MNKKAIYQILLLQIDCPSCHNLSWLHMISYFQPSIWKLNTVHVTADQQLIKVNSSSTFEWIVYYYLLSFVIFTQLCTTKISFGNDVFLMFSGVFNPKTFKIEHVFWTIFFSTYNSKNEIFRQYSRSITNPFNRLKCIVRKLPKLRFLLYVMYLALFYMSFMACSRKSCLLIIITIIMNLSIG